MRLNSLADREILRGEDDRPIGRVVDVLIDVRRGDIVYVLADPGPASDPFVLSRRRLAMVGETLRAEASEAELDRLRSRSRPTDDEPTPALDLTAFPPLVVGPFGNVAAPAMGAAVFPPVAGVFGRSAAPAMGAALMNALTGKPRRERPALDGAHAEWHWYETLHGLPVFDATSELGALDDIVFDPETLICRSLLLRDDRGNLHDLPFSAIRMVSRGETSIVLELSPKPPYSVERIVEDLS